MSNFEFNAEFDDDDDNGSFETDLPFNGRNATIFLIDCAKGMFATCLENEENHFIKTLRCVHATISRKIIANDQDLHAIIFFNTTVSKNSVDFLNIYVLQDLERTGSERILELEKLLEDVYGTFLSKHDNNIHNTSIHDVLWICRNILINSKNKLSSKNVLLFTSQDNPHKNDQHKVRQALKGAKDLSEADIDLEILPFGQDFNMKLFYQELLSQWGDDVSESLSTLADPSMRFEELLERVRRIDHKQRSSGRILFALAPGVEMGVKLFTSIRKAYKPSKHKLYKVTNEEVVSQKKEYLENGELLMPSDYVKYQSYGGRKIKFNLEEVKAVSKVFEPGIEILGFKRRSAFGADLFVKPANFIYPDEESVIGSKKLFCCLLERCIARDVCPIVRVTMRAGTAVAWAFLLPQLEFKDDKGCQDKPPGFHICYLPFADDFRSIELENRTRAQSNQVDAAKNVIKKLNFNYNPDCFENPDIQTHWRNIETLALNRTYLEPVKDYTVPDHDRMEKKAGKLIDIFKGLTLPPSYDPITASKKRPASSAASNAKKAKIDGISSSTSVEEMVKCDKVDKLNMDTMKQWLTAKGIRVTGKKKAQLVQDIYDVCASK